MLRPTLCLKRPALLTSSYLPFHFPPAPLMVQWGYGTWALAVEPNVSVWLCAHLLHVVVVMWWCLLADKKILTRNIYSKVLTYTWMDMYIVIILYDSYCMGPTWTQQFFRVKWTAIAMLPMKMANGRPLRFSLCVLDAGVLLCTKMTLLTASSFMT